MPRSFNFMEEGDKYESSSDGKYFKLENDKESAKIVFLYESVNDIQGYEVHSVKIDGNYRDVACIGEGCPLCVAGNKMRGKLYLEVYDLRDGKCKVWVRGANVFKSLRLYFERYNPPYKHLFEIVRCGKKGDLKTSYEFFYEKPLENSFESYDKPRFIITDYIKEYSRDELDKLVSGGLDVNDTQSPIIGTVESVVRRTPSNPDGAQQIDNGNPKLSF